MGNTKVLILILILNGLKCPFILYIVHDWDLTPPLRGGFFVLEDNSSRRKRRMLKWGQQFFPSFFFSSGTESVNTEAEALYFCLHTPAGGFCICVNGMSTGWICWPRREQKGTICWRLRAKCIYKYCALKGLTSLRREQKIMSGCRRVRQLNDASTVGGSHKSWLNLV